MTSRHKTRSGKKVVVTDREGSLSQREIPKHLARQFSEVIGASGLLATMKKLKNASSIATESQRQLQKTLRGFSGDMSPDFATHKLMYLPTIKDMTIDEMGEMVRRGVLDATGPQAIVELFLTKDGELFREPRNQLRYDFAVQGDRIAILHTLIDNRNPYEYMETSTLRAVTEYGSPGSLRKAIHTINRLTQSKLKIDHKLIEGKRGSGYRINPVHKITPL